MASIVERTSIGVVRIGLGSLARPAALLVALGGVVAVAAIGRVIEACLALAVPSELMSGEGILYTHATRLLQGQPLYQPFGQPPYTVAAYTPLYYVLVAGLRAVFGAGFGPGRALSLVAGLVSAGLVGYLAARLAQTQQVDLGTPAARTPLPSTAAVSAGQPATSTLAGARWAGPVAACLFLVLGFPGREPWFAYYKVDMLGVALGLGRWRCCSGARPRRGGCSWRVVWRVWRS